MRFSGHGLVVVSQVGVMASCLSTVAWAGVVQTPGSTHPRVGAIVWDDPTSLTTALQGEGLVFDILDVAGAAGGNAEFTCLGCDIEQLSMGTSGPAGATTSSGGGGGSPFGSPGRLPGAHGSKSEGAKKADATNLEPFSSTASKPTSQSSRQSPPESAFTPPENVSAFTPPESYAPPVWSGFDAAPSANSIVPTTDSLPSDPPEGSGAAATSAPEPGSILLLGSGLLGLAAAIRRRRSSR
jgi:hypothetical protein